MQNLQTFREFLNEQNNEIPFDNTELLDIFDKFKKLNPKIKKMDSLNTDITGTLHVIEYGTGILGIGVKKGIPVSAVFSEDRSHDFLKYMESKGFGPNIYTTLKKLGTSSLRGYTTIVKFK